MWHVAEVFFSSSPVLPFPSAPCPLLSAALLSFLSSSLHLSPSLSYPAFTSFAIPPHPQPTSSSPRTVTVHMVAPQAVLQGAWSVAPSASLCPLGAGCYFRYPQGLTQRSRVLPAPKLGLAAFHRHRYKHLYMTYRHTRTPPFQHPHPEQTASHKHMDT